MTAPRCEGVGEVRGWRRGGRVFSQKNSAGLVITSRHSTLGNSFTSTAVPVKALTGRPRSRSDGSATWLLRRDQP